MNHEFGKTLVLLKEICNCDSSKELPKLHAQAFELIERNHNIANEYILYQANYYSDQKKNKVPPPFDQWKDSKNHD